MYELDFTEQSQKEIAKLRKSDAQAYKKLKLLLAELREHPYIGTGHPHQLRYVDGHVVEETRQKEPITLYGQRYNNRCASIIDHGTL